MESRSTNYKRGSDKAVSPIEHAKSTVRSKAVFIMLNQVFASVANNLENNEYRNYRAAHGYKGGCTPFRKFIRGDFEEHKDQKPYCYS